MTTCENGSVVAKKYKAYTIRNIHEIEQLKDMPEEFIEEIKIVSHVLPFKTNNYVINELINWDKVPNDPIFILTFPQRDMLLPHHYGLIKQAIEEGRSAKEIEEIANKIRLELNPHPAGQKQHNVPTLDGEPLPGVQHKYRETVLFFPSQGQTCHAYCTFCFRWAQFITSLHMKFAMKEIDKVIAYLQQNPEVQDLLITGGDPMIMNAKLLDHYINAILEAKLPNLKTIRIGSKTLSYWPYRYISDPDADHILQIFSNVTDAGLHLAFMAHFNHYQELKTEAVKVAVRNILKTGAQIRTQSPILNHINNDPHVWAKMWRKQVDMGMIPYYMFVARDTGARHYFSVPLVRAWWVFNRAYRSVSGVCRTVRGPSMSATPGKIEVVGPSIVRGEKVLVLRFIQGRNPAWVGKPFFAKYDKYATWIDELQPAFGREFFFERELSRYLAPYSQIKHHLKTEEQSIHFGDLIEDET